VNVTFYRTIPAGTSRSWLERIEDRPDFRFTAKLLRDFTHGEEWSVRTVEAFREGIQPLHEAGRLTALLLQFPWSLERSADSERRVETLLDLFADWPRVVEVRHASWDTPDFRQFLREHGAGLCSLDMPVTSRSVPLEDHCTAPLAYFRLHGRNAQAWFDPEAGRDAKYDYHYSAGELDGLEARARGLAQGAEEVAIVANNHFRGQAVATALALKGRLTGERAAVPDTLMETYPELQDWCVREEGPRQGSLFP
jgi:uncharacterized protein YecE (DUF72 family)